MEEKEPRRLLESFGRSWIAVAGFMAMAMATVLAWSSATFAAVAPSLDTELVKLLLEEERNLLETVRNIVIAVSTAGAVAFAIVGYFGFSQAKRFRDIGKEWERQQREMHEQLHQVTTLRQRAETMLDETRKSALSVTDDARTALLRANESFAAVMDLESISRLAYDYDREKSGDPTATTSEDREKLEQIFDFISSVQRRDDVVALHESPIQKASFWYGWYLRRMKRPAEAFRALSAVGLSEFTPKERRGRVHWNRACYASLASSHNLSRHEIDRYVEHALSELALALQLFPDWKADAWDERDLQPLRVRRQHEFAALAGPPANER